MSNVIVRANNLSKLYHIGPQAAYYTLRDSLINRLSVWWRTNGDEVTTATNEKSSIWALKNVSFEIKRGEVIGVIGRNGAGKSTLLKILSRITEPTEGSAEIYGRVGSLLEVGTGFHPELSGRENIYLNGAILGMKKAEIDHKFDEIIAFAGVEKFTDTPVKRYSSGMSVRLAFSVAAHLETEILLLDEVLAVGDQSFQNKCLDKMQQAHKGGRTVFLVSHNTTSILQLCSRVIWLDSGTVAEQGDARDVVSRYLHDNRISLGEVVFDSSGNTGGAELVRAYVTSDSLQVRPDIPYLSPLFIAIEYKVDSQIEGLRVGFRLHNQKNVAVLHTATSDSPLINGKAGEPGRHRAWVRIPGAWLAPGRYYAELGIWSPKVGHHQHVYNALAFDITSAPMESVGDEVLRPVLDWTIED